MKTKILMFAFLMSCSVLSFAQSSEGKDLKKQDWGHNREMLRHGAPEGPEHGLNLTDEQKETFKKSMLAMQKQLQPIRNELAEAEVHQKTLETAEKPDMAAINKNLEKIGALKVEIAKIQTKNRMDLRAQLTDEQRLKFDLFHEKMKEGKGPRGMKEGNGPQQMMKHHMEMQGKGLGK